MLTLSQLQLVRRIELFVDSVFLPATIDEKGVERHFYIASDKEFSDWLAIPSSAVSHLANVHVQTLISDSFSASYLDFLTSEHSKNFDVSPLLSSGEVVTPPLCAVNPA